MDRIRKEIPASGPNSGHVATYIPQLAKANPDSFGAAICSVNGEFYSCGDDQVPFSVQSCIKPFTYLIACDELSMTTVHQYVSREPSGQAFNAYSLTEDNLPFNPLINAGAITICNLIGQKDRKTSAERFEHLQKTLDGIGTDDGRLPFHTGFDNAVFMSERDTGFNNYALAHFMRNKHDTTRPYTPPTSVTRVEDDLEFYFQACRYVRSCPGAWYISD